MPEMKKGESKSEWMSKCVPHVKREGKSQEQAVGKCLGMWRQKHGKRADKL